MQEQIENYRQWLSDTVDDRLHGNWDTSLVAGYEGALSKFNELFPITTPVTTNPSTWIYEGRKVINYNGIVITLTDVGNGGIECAYTQPHQFPTTDMLDKTAVEGFIVDGTWKLID